MLDPLAVFLRDTFDERGLTPIPLVSTDHDVVIAAGLAVVTTHRLFKNVEPQSIEAVLTFPLPVLATLFELTAEVEGRRLQAKAQVRAEARRTYEDAIDRGKSAVLHEELLRGVHMISVANIQTGSEIRVTTKWALPLSVVGDHATLRIPQTVGDIYGRSSLVEADDIVSGGARQPVLLSVQATGNVTVNGQGLVGGQARLMNSKPIDIVADIWAPTPIAARTSLGQALALTLSPQPAGEKALSLAVLVDHSGSMSDCITGEGETSAHDAASNGVYALASTIGDKDYIDLWEFDTRPTHVGTATGSRTELAKLVERLTPPRGGTEIGLAIDAVLNASVARDVLLLTDGLSDELDVQKLSKSGRRISVILIGDASLEAKIGHLAALTGGALFIATADDLEAVMAAAIEGLRRSFTPLPSIKEMPKRLECNRNNVLMRAEWSAGIVEPASHELGRAAVAVASALIVSCGEQALASQVAAAEGIVSHLTSLVLVDEVSSSQEALPALRKVALPSPDVMYSASYDPLEFAEEHCQMMLSDIDAQPLFERNISYSKPRGLVSTNQVMASPARLPLKASLSSWDGFQYRRQGRISPISRLLSKLTGGNRQSFPSLFHANMKSLARQIDWGRAPNDLIRGNLTGLPDEVAACIRKLSELEAAAKFAELNGLTPQVLVIGSLARSIASEDRRANRVWKAISDLMKSSLPEELAKLELQMVASL